MSEKELRVAIIGAGMAGRAAAKEIRKRLPASLITLITEDAGRAYAKPMLSNALSKGVAAESLASQSAERVAQELGLEMKANASARRLDLQARRVELDNGEIVSYDALVLACGADPIDPGLVGDGADLALAINHLDHYEELRRRLESRSGAKASVAILGAGLIGCEFADDLLSAGHPVTLIDPNDRPLSALCPPELSEGLRRALEAKGAKWALEARAIQARRLEGGRVELTLSSGETIQADELISAVGLRPRAALARAAGLEIGRGVRVFEGCETRTPGVYALGDCAEYAQGEGSGRWLPYVAPIISAAKVIAAHIAGEREAWSAPEGAVVVKTPSFPLALAPPPPGAEGVWESAQEQGRLVCRFKDARGRVRGFGIAPHDAGSRKRLEAEIAPLEAPPARA